MTGLEADLTPPEIASTEPHKPEPRSKRARKASSSESSADQQSSSSAASKVDPATVLITQVLPAVAQLHLSTWRGQVCEEIRNSAHRLWSKPGEGGAPGRPPASWQRRLECECGRCFPYSTLLGADSLFCLISLKLRLPSPFPSLRFT